MDSCGLFRSELRSAPLRRIPQASTPSRQSGSEPEIGRASVGRTRSEGGGRRQRGPVKILETWRVTGVAHPIYI